MYNTKEGYGIVSRFFHWGMAVVFITVMMAGFLMDDFIPKESKKQVMLMHKGFGISIFVMVLFRILWKLRNLTPGLPNHIPQWQTAVARLNVLVLYLGMILFPLSGVSMSLFNGHPVSFFNLFMIPALDPKIPELGRFFHSAHVILPYIIGSALLLHIGAALIHHFYYRDNVLKRMLFSSEK